eukprot:gb/GEZN01018132.1/.p1 GENE.gb/GEZN01018132.1/~~gb/GEZN01018132.1/.p1  ORF type:complete len:162 (-),score=12.45 gb/GEZN01018132.1/:283-744(-)
MSVLRINIKTPTGQMARVSMSSSSSVSMVKARLEETVGIEVASKFQRLIFNGKELEDSSCLDCIPDGATVEILLRKLNEEEVHKDGRIQVEAYRALLERLISRALAAARAAKPRYDAWSPLFGALCPQGHRMSRGVFHRAPWVCTRCNLVFST